MFRADAELNSLHYWLFSLVGLLFFSLGHASEQPVAQETRVAIVIGNSNYKYAPKLTNPQNDALSVRSFLEKKGFIVHNFLDLKSDQVSEIRALTESSITRETNFFFFYAGHGIQSEGRNFLVSSDARADTLQNLTDDSLYLGDILAAIDKRRPRLAVVILDACRNNPFQAQGVNSLKTGLARVDPPSSTVIFYATRPGGLAADGQGSNGLFTASWLDLALGEPDTPIEVLFRKSANAVFKQSKGEQEPWIEGVIREEFKFSQMPTEEPVVLATSISANDNPIQTEGEARLASESNPASPPDLGDTSIIGSSKPELSPISWEKALEQISSEDSDSPQTYAQTLFKCDEIGCLDYKTWAKDLTNEQELESLKSSAKDLSTTSSVKLCEFSLKEKKCITDELEFTIINPLMLFNSGYISGFDILDSKPSKSGGLSFNAKLRGGSKWFGVGRVEVSCTQPEGRLEFLNDRIEFEIAQSACVGVSISTEKMTLDVLAVDFSKKAFLARWSFSMFAGVAGGTGSGLTLITMQ